MSETPEAETYFEIIAICPECNTEILVEFIEPYDECLTDFCSECLTEFKYKSPELTHEAVN